MALKLCGGTKVSHYPSTGSFHMGVFLVGSQEVNGEMGFKNGKKRKKKKKKCIVAGTQYLNVLVKY